MINMIILSTIYLRHPCGQQVYCAGPKWLQNVFGEDGLVDAAVMIFAEVLEPFLRHVLVFKHCGHSKLQVIDW